MKRFTLYDDFKELYKKTVIPVDKMQHELIGYYIDHKDIKGVVKNFDSTLSLKASK